MVAEQVFKIHQRLLIETVYWEYLFTESLQILYVPDDKTLMIL